MDHLQYLLRQLSKTNKKNYENYVITAIWHRLNSLDYKIITQQYVVRPNGKYALTDLYFPQLGLHIEVDEAHHQLQAIADQTRELDIVNITNHEIIRIDVNCDITALHQQIDHVVERIKSLREAMGHAFVPFSLQKERDPQTYIDRGYIEVEDQVAFNRIVDAINCFGVQYLGWQQGGCKHPREAGVLLWFPKLYMNKDWDNRISNDDSIIYERSAIASKVEGHIEQVIDHEDHVRIVFARVKDAFGDVCYKFMGKYELNVAQSRMEQQLVWQRVATRVVTYM